jgi:large subunit ribosomal protein L11
MESCKASMPRRRSRGHYCAGGGDHLHGPPFTLSPNPTGACVVEKAAGIAKGSAEPNRSRVGQVSREQIREIAQLKGKDLNSYDLEAAMKTIEGTARSMGIEVVP